MTSTVAVCKDLRRPDHGAVSITGSRATYHCNPPYTLQGDRTRVCRSGKWQGKEPACKGEDKAVEDMIHMHAHAYFSFACTCMVYSRGSLSWDSNMPTPVDAVLARTLVNFTSNIRNSNSHYSH